MADFIDRRVTGVPELPIDEVWVLKDPRGYVGDGQGRADIETSIKELEKMCLSLRFPFTILEEFESDPDMHVADITSWILRELRSQIESTSARGEPNLYFNITGGRKDFAFATIFSAIRMHGRLYYLQRNGPAEILVPPLRDYPDLRKNENYMTILRIIKSKGVKGTILQVDIEHWMNTDGKYRYRTKRGKPLSRQVLNPLVTKLVSLGLVKVDKRGRNNQVTITEQGEWVIEAEY